MTTLPAVVVVLWTILAAAFGAPRISTQDGGGVFTEYHTGGGSPYRVCAQTSETVWFTLPAQNMLGRLNLTPSVSIQTFPLPHAGSHPYDIACAGGLVWLTELAGNRIAQFNPATSSWVEYPIDTLASQPTGLDVQPGDPTEVWFVERAGNKVGHLVVPVQGRLSLSTYLP
jgi:streptogramin lyase